MSKNLQPSTHHPGNQSMRTTALFQHAIPAILLLGGLISTSVCAAEGSANAATAVDLSAAAPSKFDPAPGWPMVSGPYGNFNPRRYGHELVDSFSQARLLWKSDTGVLGMGKMFLKGGGAGNMPPGTASGVLVAQGMVMGNGFAPRGHVLPFGVATGGNLEKIQSLWSVEADDLFVAYDQRTGRTIWQVNEINQGVHRGMGKRSGFHSTPVWHDGKLFGIGTTLRAYAYDAATGRKLWESDLGPSHAAAEFHKQRCLDNRVLAGSGSFASAAVAASPAGSTDRAVVVMPRYAGGGGVDVGLIGFDPTTGTVLWEITEGVQSSFAAPAVWTHAGRQYLLTASQQGKLRMIDPGTGKVLWSEPIAPMWKPVITSEKYAFVMMTTTPSEEFPNRGEAMGHYACFEISPQGAKKVWEEPNDISSASENHFDIGPWREVLVRDGLLFKHALGSYTPQGKKTSYLTIHRAATGETLIGRSANVHLGSAAYFLEDRYINLGDTAHSSLGPVGIYNPDPAKFALLAPTAGLPSLDAPTGGYEVLMEYPYVDGIMFMRTKSQGRINAVDLRKNPPKDATAPLPLPEWAAKLLEPVRLLASRYRDERDAAAAKLIALPVAQRPLPELLGMAGHQDHLVRQAAAQVLAASAAGLGAHAEAARKLVAQALAGNDEDGLELFIPIALAVDGPALVKALEPAIVARLTDPKQSRLALKSLALTGKAGRGLVDKVLPLLGSNDDRVVRDAAYALARIGGGDAKVVAGLLGLLGPIGTVGKGDSHKLLAVASAMGALRHLAETGGIPADPEKLLPLCSQKVEVGKRGRFGPHIWDGKGGYWLTRMLVASHQGEAAVPVLCEEIDAILTNGRAVGGAYMPYEGFVGATAAAARFPAVRERLKTIAAGQFSNESTAAAKLLAATK